MKTNQIPLFVKTAEDMERSMSSAITNIHTQCRARQVFIKYGNKCTKKSIGYSDITVQRRANELGFRVSSLTNRSVTLIASSIANYYRAIYF